MWFSLHDFKQMSIWFMVRSDFSNLRSRRNIINLLFSNIKLLFFKKKSNVKNDIYIFSISFDLREMSLTWRNVTRSAWPTCSRNRRYKSCWLYSVWQSCECILEEKSYNEIKKNGYDAKMTKHKWLSEGRLEHIDIVVSKKAQVLPEARLFPWCVLGKNPGSCLPYSRNQDHWKSCGTGGT